jgi:hypothetical protein
MEENIIEGFILMNDSGQVLSKTHEWKTVKTAEEGAVFTDNEIWKIRRTCSAWESRPEIMLRARSENGRVSLCNGWASKF